MLIAFILSMPNVGSWNGKWSGNGEYYAIVKNFKKANICNAEQIRDTGYFHYNFGDGWSAGVEAKEVTSKEAAVIRRKTKGFCGYDWMVTSIVDNLKIQCR